VKLGPDASGLPEGLSNIYAPRQASSQSLSVYHWEKKGSEDLMFGRVTR
jgi:hypothetical protein